MSLLDGDSLSEIFAFPTDQLLALPNLLTEDFDQGEEFVRRLASGTPPSRRPVIHIPAWDEVIHIVPESLLPEDEQAARRRERAIRISRSPVPESVRAIGSIMTWVDDVQDALLTAAIIARLGSVFYKPLIPVALGLGAAAEAVNIFGLAGNLATAPLTGKFRATSAMRSLLGTQVVRGLRTPGLQRAIPTVGEALQIAQTTDQLFGTGVSLGPVVGLLQDLVFGSVTGADFTFQSGIEYKDQDEVFLRVRDQAHAEAGRLHGPLGSIVRGSKAASWVLATPDGLSFSDRTDALVLLSLVAELARGFLPKSRWTPLVLPALDRDRAATGQLRPKTALAIYRLGIDPYNAESYPIEGNPKRLTGLQEEAAIRKAAPAALDSWMKEAPSITARLFAEQVTTDLPFRMIRAFEGCPCHFEVHGTPIWRATIDSLELGLKPPAGAEKKNITAYLEAARSLYEQDPTRKTPIRELTALHIAHFQNPSGS